MNDDQMDELLIQGVRDYNEPREVPRDEMWKRIREERNARSETRDARGGTRHTKFSHLSSRYSRLAIAAGVILAAGIVIGRALERGLARPQPIVAVVPPSVQPKHDSVESEAKAVVSPSPTVEQQLHEETAKTDRRVRELASASPDRGTPQPSNQRDLAYRLVVLRHLAGSEAMITAFRASARSGQADAQLATWSKELLSTTRLLETSDATKDPVMKRLLEDLDLVISQIVQYTTRGVTDAEELDLIEQSINKRGLITKLRSTNSGQSLTAGL